MGHDQHRAGGYWFHGREAEGLSRSGNDRKVFTGIFLGNLIQRNITGAHAGGSPMGEDNAVQRLRFMELVQKCLPFRWQRYWHPLF
jgi:hypothetical protein